MHTSAHPPFEDRRTAGALLHPTSLPGRYGIGDLGDEAIAFLDFLASSGMTLWQVLPLNPPGYGYSPYACLSSFAGNPLLISPQRMLEDGLLDARQCADPPPFANDHVEFERAAAYKFSLLRSSWKRFARNASFDAFIAAEQEWLDDFALYMALKEAGGGQPWWEWDA